MASSDLILVTGAGGFIGSRLCERLAELERPVRALVRDRGRAARAAAAGAELVVGDLLDPSSVASALRGAGAVVHLAHGEDDEAPRATRNLVDAATRAGIDRLVHVSSMSVHGPFPGLDAAREETARIGRYGDAYCDAKAEEEEIVRRAIAGGLRATILRPTVVYGPHGPFAAQLLDEARGGTLSLLDGGAGRCNAVYVDDVCDALVAALGADAALGEAMFVNADRAVSWRDFALAFTAALRPPPAIRDVAAAAARAHWEAQRSRRDAGSVRGLLGKLARRVAAAPILRDVKGRLDDLRPGGVPAWPSWGRVVRESCKVDFSNEKAKRLLGWRPRHDFQQGAAATVGWLRASGRLPREG